MARRGLESAAIAFLVAILVVAASVGVIAIRTATVSSSTFSTESQSNSTVSTGTFDGLRLSLSASPSVVYSGSPVNISISDYNTFSTTNSPAIAGPPVVGEAAITLGPCSQLPLGFGIYEGYYVSANLSEGTRVNVFPEGVYSCPAEYAVAYFSFAPNSDEVSLYSPQPSGTGNATVPTKMWTNPDSFTQNFTGYWPSPGQVCLQMSLCSQAVRPFEPGVYTLVGGDEYGQMAIVHFNVQPSLTITTQSGTGSTPGLSVSVASFQGLRLDVAMNSTTILSGGAVQVTLSEFNTFSTSNNVSSFDRWATQVALGPCENIYVQPFGIAVFAGHLDEQNLSQSQQLRIYPEVACPLFVRLVTGYEFQPLSDRATILPGSAAPSPLVGSVNVGMLYSSGAQPLPPGAYTVVAADEWGALVFLYFKVL